MKTEYKQYWMKNLATNTNILQDVTHIDLNNCPDGNNILWSKIEKVIEFKYLGQSTHLKDTTKRRNICHDQSSVELFWKKKTTRKYSKIDNSSFH